MVENQDILIEQGGMMPGGLSVIGYWALVQDVAVWPTASISPSSYEDAALLTGDFEMKEGKGFQKIESDLEMSELAGTSQGEMNYLSSDNRYSFTQCGTSKQLIGMINTVRNRNVVVLLSDFSGSFRQIGEQTLPGKFVAFKESGGKKTADLKAVEFTVYAPGRLAMFYAGIIPLVPAVPLNAIIDENGVPIVDEIGDYLISE